MNQHGDFKPFNLIHMRIKVTRRFSINSFNPPPSSAVDVSNGKFYINQSVVILVVIISNWRKFITSIVWTERTQISVLQSPCLCLGWILKIFPVAAYFPFLFLFLPIISFDRSRQNPELPFSSFNPVKRNQFLFSFLPVVEELRFPTPFTPRIMARILLTSWDHLRLAVVWRNILHSWFGSQTQGEISLNQKSKAQTCLIDSVAYVVLPYLLVLRAPAALQHLLG